MSKYIKPTTIIPTIIITLILLALSWEYLWLISKVAGILVSTWLLCLIGLLFLSLYFSAIERWHLFQATTSEYKATIAENTTKASYYHQLEARVPEMIEAAIDQVRNGVTYFEDALTFKSKPLPITNNMEMRDNMNLLPTSIAVEPLMPALKKAQRILVIGGMGSGKTTLLLHLAKAKTDEGEVRVIDTHSSPTKWPKDERLSVIGSGRNYDQVKSNITGLVNTMDLRFKDIAANDLPDRYHPVITMIADEWTMLPTMIPGLREMNKALLSESRKAAIDFVIAAHDLTVESIGVKGMGNLREAFDAIVHCSRNAATNEYTTEVQWGWSSKVRQAYISPGPYNIVTHGVVPGRDPEVELAGEEEIIDLEQPEYSFTPQLSDSPEDKALVLKHFKWMSQKPTFSWNLLSLEIYGRKGGTYNQKIKSILDEYSVDYSQYV